MTNAAPKASAMVLAAGRGERMRPLTDHTPKPLLEVHGKPLMQWPMEALTIAGFDRLVINIDWLGDQIARRFGSQPSFDDDAGAASITYSDERRDFGGALETAGGIVRALPLLGDVFWVAAGDVFAPGFTFSRHAFDRFAASGKLGHLWLVPNPAHHPKGDFGIASDGRGLSRPGASDTAYTFSTIALYRTALFAPPYCDIPAGNPGGIKAPLAPILRAAMDNDQVSAELYTGPWTDVGTPERLALLNSR
ncbi:MAG: nucleotidyltransferase [Variovorax sp.]|nr:nucleotidyltransferase [Variovorax sp.]